VSVSRSSRLSCSRRRMRSVAASSRQSSEVSLARWRSGTTGAGELLRWRSRRRSTSVRRSVCVEPGTGDAGRAGDGVEGDRRAGGIESAQRFHGPLTGVLAAPACRGPQMAGVVSPHARPHSARSGRRRSCHRGW
jgi:hypothetical protein